MARQTTARLLPFAPRQRSPVPHARSRSPSESKQQGAVLPVHTERERSHPPRRPMTPSVSSIKSCNSEWASSGSSSDSSSSFCATPSSSRSSPPSSLPSSPAPSILAFRKLRPLPHPPSEGSPVPSLTYSPDSSKSSSSRDSAPPSPPLPTPPPTQDVIIVPSGPQSHSSRRTVRLPTPPPPPPSLSIATSSFSDNDSLKPPRPPSHSFLSLSPVSSPRTSVLSSFPLPPFALPSSTESQRASMLSLFSGSSESTVTPLATPTEASAKKSPWRTKGARSRHRRTSAASTLTMPRPLPSIPAIKINAIVPPSSMPFSPREYDTPINAHGWSLAGNRRSWFRWRTGEEQWIPGDHDIVEDDSMIDWDLIDEVMASSG